MDLIYPVTPTHYLLLSACLFGIDWQVFYRAGIIFISLMSLELMLNAVGSDLRHLFPD